MARTVIAATSLSVNAGTNVKNATVATTIDATNSHYFATDGKTKLYLIHVKNTNGSNRVATVSAGDNPPAFRAGIGDLAVTVAATDGEQMIIVESDRFVQGNGDINIDIAASMAGTIAVYKLPTQFR